jgi:hypothetical protein
MSRSQIDIPLQSKWVVHYKREPYDVLVMRPGPWGNPYRIGVHGTREEVLQKYQRYLDAHPYIKRAIKEQLRGKVLGCCCAPLPCHADILARLANED